MRKKLINLNILLIAAAFLVLGPVYAKANEQDIFDDDGVVEDVQDENSAENVEELSYESPQYEAEKFHFVDHFDNVDSSKNLWVKSEAKKDDIAEEIAKYDGEWSWESPQRIVWKQDKGLVLKSKAKHAAIAARLQKTFNFKDNKPLIVQYEVTLQEGQECGGSYIKLLSAGDNTKDLTKFNDKTPYTIMFGPDKCGNDIKMHFIFRHVNPINGSIEEKHSKKPKDRLEEPFKDKLPHLYHLLVRPDNSFEIRVDHKVINSGSLLTDFQPPVNPPREIDDPEDKKPKDWDEREKIPDPTAEKPEDWDDDAPPQIPDPSAVMPEGWLEDEPEMIPDANAVKPEDWDADIDGEWEAPLVENPVCEKGVGCGVWKAPLIQNKEFKGKWRAPLIDNPNYQGKWAARKIQNPDYFEDNTPFFMTPISAIGIELWSMSSDILFDNLIITDDAEVARDFAAKSFDIKRKYIDQEAETFLNKIAKLAKENPWAWRIAIVLFGTPLAFLMYRTLRGGQKTTPSDADAKKTDAEQKDDADAKEGADDTGDKKNASQKRATKKSDLNVSSDSDGAGARSSPTTEQDTEGLIGDAENDETEETADKPSHSNSGNARKRRVRKDVS